MTDEVLKELWIAKDNIAKEHGYSIDALADYLLRKQIARRDRFYRGEKGVKAEQSAPADARTSRG